jgi:hypothetical protein
VYGKAIGKIQIPATINTSGTGGTATVIANPSQTTVSPTWTSTTDGGGNDWPGGALYYNNKLLLGRAWWYDNNTTRQSIASTASFPPSGTITFETFSNGTSPYTNGRFYGGYFGTIPSDWQSLIGYPAFTGASAMSILSTCSAGPTFFAFNPDNIGTGSNSALWLMGYPNGGPTVTGHATTDLWRTNGATGMYFTPADVYHAGMVWPPGSRSILFIFQHGTGTYCYGTGCIGVNELCGTGQGEQAPPYVRYVLAFDANDLLAVKNGTKQPYEVVPYAHWQMPTMAINNSSDCSELYWYGQLAYDASTGRIYTTLNYGNDPQVHVFQVTTTATSTYRRASGGGTIAGSIH